MSKKQKLNEDWKDVAKSVGGFFIPNTIKNLWRGAAGAWRSGMAGSASASGTQNINQAKDDLTKEIEAAWNNFAVSLKKVGYSDTQIQDMQDAFEINIANLVKYATSNYM
jgi:hypothetical protein